MNKGKSPGVDGLAPDDNNVSPLAETEQKQKNLCNSSKV